MIESREQQNLCDSSRAAIELLNQFLPSFSELSEITKQFHQKNTSISSLLGTLDPGDSTS